MRRFGRGSTERNSRPLDSIERWEDWISVKIDRPFRISKILGRPRRLPRLTLLPLSLPHQRIVQRCRRRTEECLRRVPSPFRRLRRRRRNNRATALTTPLPLLHTTPTPRLHRKLPLLDRRRIPTPRRRRRITETLLRRRLMVNRPRPTDSQRRIFPRRPLPYRIRATAPSLHHLDNPPTPPSHPTPLLRLLSRRTTPLSSPSRLLIISNRLPASLRINRKLNIRIMALLLLRRQITDSRRHRHSSSSIMEVSRIRISSSISSGRFERR